MFWVFCVGHWFFLSQLCFRSSTSTTRGSQLDSFSYRSDSNHHWSDPKLDVIYYDWSQNILKHLVEVVHIPTDLSKLQQETAHTLPVQWLASFLLPGLLQDQIQTCHDVFDRRTCQICLAVSTFCRNNRSIQVSDSSLVSLGPMRKQKRQPEHCLNIRVYTWSIWSSPSPATTKIRNLVSG